MATALGEAVIEVVGDTSGLKSDVSKGTRAAFAGAGKAADSEGKKTGRKFGRTLFAGAAKVAGPLAAAFGAAQAANFVKGSISAASDLDESINAIRVSYGDAADDILKLGESSATSFGLSQTELNNFAVRFSAFSQNIAGKGGDSAKVFENIAGRATDFASVMNLEVADAAQIFQSGLAGETEPLRQFGIDLSAAAIEAHAVEEGIAKAGGEMSEQQKVQARYSLLMKETNKVADDFANTSDGLANQQRILGARFAEVRTEFGNKLLPIATKFFGFLNDTAIPIAEGLVDMMGGGGGGVSGVLEKAAGVFEHFGGNAEVASLIMGQVGEAIADLVSHGQGLVKSLMPAFMAVGGAVEDVAQAVLPILQSIANRIAVTFIGQGPEIKAVMTEIATVVKMAAKLIALHFSTMAKVITKVWEVIGPFVMDILDGLIKNIIGVLGGFIKVISGILTVLVGLFTGDFDMMKKGVTKIWKGLWKIISTVMFSATKLLEKWLGGWIKKLVNGFLFFWRSLKNSFLRNWDTLTDRITEPLAVAASWVRKTVGGSNSTVAIFFKNLWNWVRGTFGNWWDNITNLVTAPIRMAREFIGDTFGRGGTVRNMFGNFWDWIKTRFISSWRNFPSLILGPLQKVLDKVQSFFGQGGRVRRVFGFFQDFVGNLFGKGGSLRTMFDNAVDAFGRIWRGIRSEFMSPVRWIKKNVFKGILLPAINAILNFAGKDPIKLAGGGPAFGPGGPTSDMIDAKLSNGEHVWTAREVARFGGHAKMEAWRKAVDAGKAFDMPQFAGGGGVSAPVPGGFAPFPSYPGHTGVDYPVGRGTPIRAVMDGVIKAVRSMTTSYGKHVTQSLPVPGANEALYAHMMGFNVKPGQKVNAGDLIGWVNNTGRSFGDHLHFTRQFPGGNYVDPTSLLRGAVEPKGGLLSRIWGGVKGAAGSLIDFAKKFGLPDLSPLGDSPLGGMLKGVANRAKELALEKAKGLVPFGAGGGIPDGDAVKRWTGHVRSALTMAGVPTSPAYVNAWLRQIRSESGGNPSILQQVQDVNSGGNEARGLVQVIPSTFAAYRNPNLPNDRNNPLANLFAGINYARNRYGLEGMLGVIGHGHGYDQGGWLPPGLSLNYNGTGRKEPAPVFTQEQWETLNRLANSGGEDRKIELEQNFYGPTTSGGRLREIEWTLRYATGARKQTRGGVPTL